MKSKMRIILLWAGFLVLCAPVFSQDKTKFYAEVSPSVVYLRHEIEVNQYYVSYKRSWEKLEEVIGSPVINSYLTIGSGSGFFIDDEGRIITNRHVAEIQTLASFRYGVFQNISSYFDSLKGRLSDGDIANLKYDLTYIAKNAATRFVAYVGNESLGDVKVLALSKQDEDDVALVEVSNFKSKPLELLDVGNDYAYTGREVVALGYPRGSDMDESFNERIVTMSSGTITGFRRNDKLDIQHSATTTFGNSGGPLVDVDGRVIGINTAITIDKQIGNFNYSKSVAGIRNFLSKHQREDLLFWNKTLANIANEREKASSRLTKISFESAVEGTEIWYNKKRLGTCPFEYELLPGNYSFVPQSKVQALADIDLVVSGEKQQVRINQESVVEIVFSNLSLYGEDIEIQLKGNKKVFNATIKDGALRLPLGNYLAQIKGLETLEGELIPVNVTKDGQEINISQYFKRSSLRIKGLVDGSTVWIDNKKYKARGDLVENIPIGLREVNVLAPGFEQLEDKVITVRSDGKSFITFSKEADKLSKSSSSFWLGLGFIGAGGAVFGINAALGQSDGTTMNVIAGIFGGMGVIFEFDALILSDIHNTERSRFYAGLEK